MNGPGGPLTAWSRLRTLIFSRIESEAGGLRGPRRGIEERRGEESGKRREWEKSRSGKAKSKARWVPIRRAARYGGREGRRGLGGESGHLRGRL